MKLKSEDAEKMVEFGVVASQVQVAEAAIRLAPAYREARWGWQCVSIPTAAEIEEQIWALKAHLYGGHRLVSCSVSSGGLRLGLTGGLPVLSVDKRLYEKLGGGK